MNNYTVLYSLVQLQKIANTFQQHIVLTSQNKKTSLSYLSYPLPHSQTNLEKHFQSMIVGGSVFEKAIIEQAGKQISILNLEKSHVPLFTDKEVFLRFIHSHIDSSVQCVAINFTYPTQPVIINNVIDGQLSSGTKGHTFIDLIGKNVGEELSRYVKRLGKTLIFTLANDTICLLLSGMKNANTIIAGGVIGTGMNFGLFDGKHLVNLESGNFDEFPQTETGKQVDKQSNNPGLQLFEKEVSGKYLFEHFNLIAKQHNIPLSLSSTSELHNLALNNNGSASQIAQSLFERSASLAACQIAGIYHFLDQKQLEFIMEGTVFWTGWNFKSMVEKYLILLGIPQEAVRFTKIVHSNILGAAKLITGI